MKTRVLIIIGIGLYLGLSATTAMDTEGLSCGASTLQNQYDYADHVFHGALISKQHDAVNPSQTTMVFDVHKSFKGTDSKQVYAEFNEGYDKKFEQGHEYVVFAHGDKQPFEVELCSTSYHAFPTVIDMISKLNDKNNDFGKTLGYDVYLHLSESEKTQLEGLSESYAQERQKEREVFFGQALLLGITASIGGGVVVLWVRALKKPKKK